jgi:hypothetical protein
MVFAVLVAAVVAALVGAAKTPAKTTKALVATNVPAVQGPIASTAEPGDPSHNYVFYSTPMDLKKVGYVEQEFFINGIAKRFTATAPNPASPIGEMPYKTRIVIRRPSNPRQFSGVVVVDWQNVTAGHDIDTEWGGPGGFFVKHGGSGSVRRCSASASTAQQPVRRLVSVSGSGTRRDTAASI